MRRCLRRLCATAERAVEEYDVVIVGGGPAGLCTAIRLKQLAEQHAGGADALRIALVEKGSQIGAHTLSGACIQPNALAELFPDWKEQGAPLRQEVTEDHFLVLTKTGHYESPILPSMLHNHGNYIVSLGEVCQWLGEKAEGLGVEVFCGFAASEPVFNEKKTALEGIQLNDVGINKKGEKSSQYQPGMVLKAKQTILAEGCRGSLTKILEKAFALRTKDNFQTYGLGVKEVWELPKDNFKAGRVVHTCGWPLARSEGHDNTYGGTWSYEFGENFLSVGFVTGLDYSNPYTRPYMEFQKWKTHPSVAPKFKGGKPIFYGARTLVEGGLAAQPKLSFPGGVLVGDCAGFLNLPKIKGTHTAMKSGLLAAESVFADVFKNGKSKPDYGVETKEYNDRYRSSWLYKELHTVRNVRQMFAMNFWAGVLYTGVTSMVTGGAEPFTMAHKHRDNECLKPIDSSKKIEYPKPDNVLTFDLLTNHARSGTAHNADQPAHLKVADMSTALNVNLKVYGGPEGRYCPAQVYEFVDDGKGGSRLQINAPNCLHCKACDIKDPKQNINWTTPEGGGGPNYNARM